MPFLVLAGSALSLMGIAALFWCILLVRRARRAGLDEDAMRRALQRVVAVNLGALGVSALGLMLVVVGIMLD